MKPETKDELGLPAALVRHQRRLAKALERLKFADDDIQKAEDAGLVVRGFSITRKGAEGLDVLITIRALDHEGGPIVGFIGGEGLIETLDKAIRALRAGEVKWRTDEWAVDK